MLMRDIPGKPSELIFTVGLELGARPPRFKTNFPLELEHKVCTICMNCTFADSTLILHY